MCDDPQDSISIGIKKQKTKNTTTEKTQTKQT